MNGQATSSMNWALQVLLQVLVWVGPAASKYIDQLVNRLGGNQDAYEVLDYKASLEVLDVKGTRAVYTKRERIRFIRDHIACFYDYGWGTGDAFASHRVSPGRVIERRQVGPRYRSLVVLPEPQNKGDEMMLEVRRLVREGLIDKRNWLEAEVNHTMQHLKLSVTLPASRKVLAARFIKRREQQESPLAIRCSANNRQHLVANVVKPPKGDLYTLEWDW